MYQTCTCKFVLVRLNSRGTLIRIEMFCNKLLLRSSSTYLAFYVFQQSSSTDNALTAQLSVLSDEDVSIFNEGLKILGYRRENIVPHGNYLVNLGSPDQTTYDKSYAYFVTELKICEQLQVPWV